MGLEAVWYWKKSTGLRIGGPEFNSQLCCPPEVTLTT